MAILGIDHIVIISDDLDTLVASYRAAGFTVTPGGRHPWGTHNALVPLDDGFYIELISFWTDDHDAHRRHARLQKGGGLIEFMLMSDDIESDIAAANDRGAAYANPAPGRRIRPDGIEISWLDGATTDDTAGTPSLIQDLTDRMLRVPGGDARLHKNGVCGLDRLILVVADLDQAVDRFMALLDSPPEPNGADGSAIFLIGPHYIELHQPVPHSEMADHLSRFGDSPYAVTFYGDWTYHIQNKPGGASVSGDIGWR